MQASVSTDSPGGMDACVKQNKWIVLSIIVFQVVVTIVWSNLA